MLPVVWGAQALDEFDNIVGYIAQFDKRASIKLHDRIEDAILPLSRYPYIGRPGREDGMRELIAHPNYIVIYQVRAADVRIVSVLHARQEYP
jgi:plasmid stabilization system protein ParE